MFLILYAASAFGYSMMDGLSFPGETLSINYNFSDDANLHLKAYRQLHSAYSNEMIYHSIYESSLASLKKIESFGISQQCDPDNFLEIYEITEAQINMSNHHPKSLDTNLTEYVGSIWGYFDPRLYEKKIDSIVVSQHDDKINSTILSHEIAHYWYSSYCVSEHNPGLSSEEFAVEIQELTSDIL